MKTIRIKIALIGGVAVVLVAWLVRTKTPHGPAPAVPSPAAQKTNVPLNETAQPKPILAENRNILHVKLAAAFTDEEKKELADKFAKKLKPAAERWFRAYGSHVPFDPAELTLEKLSNRMGKSSHYTYMFVLGDFTLAIRDSDAGAKVTYLMSRKAAMAMNALPASGAAPDLTIRVNQTDIVEMVQADTGVQFKPNEVIIRPAAAATAMNGGEFVHTIPAGADPNNGLSSKVDMVFDGSGKLVNYDRDPFF